MTQDEIFNQTTAIILQYTKCHGVGYFTVAAPVLNILAKRGIHRGKPMYATARLLVLRDVLNELEGNYTNPAQL